MPPIPEPHALPGRDATWVLMHSRQQEHFGATGRRIVCYDAPPDEAVLATIERVHLWAPPGDPLLELPALISRLPALAWLSIGPGRIAPTLAPGLRAGMLPGSLRCLEIVAGTGSTYTWPAGPMPALESLYVEVPLRFDPADFPALRSLSLYPDKRGVNLDAALGLPLRELNLLNAPFDESLFPRLEGLPLQALGLLAGRGLQTLDGIGRLAGLRSLRLKNLPALRSIAAVAALGSLDRLDVQYCKRIADIGVLADLPALRDLTLVGCGDIGLGPLAGKLAATLRRAHIAATE